MLDNPLIKKPCYCHLWNILLLLAQHKQSEFIWNNKKWTLEKGQLLTGREKLAELSGIKEATVERILKYLENEHQITQLKTTKFRIITVVNWEIYQGESEGEQQIDNKGTTDEQQADTYKNDKKIKNEKNRVFVPPTFEEVKSYVQEKGYTIDPKVFFDYFTTSEPPWVDSRGNRVRSWKQKLITWNSKDNGGSRNGHKPANQSRRNLADTPDSKYGEEIKTD